jgi:YbbR domain-containing protein
MTEVTAMFRNNKVNLVISIVVAIMLWAYVVGQVNPETQQTYSGITIQITNQNVLRNQGLAINDPGTLQVDVTITGTRRAVKKVTSSEIRATINAADLSKGENNAEIKISVPSGVSVEKQSQDSVSITVDDLVTQTKSVSADFTGSKDKGTEIGKVTVDPKTVQVSGTRSQLDKIRTVSASVAASKISAKQTSVTADLTPVNAKGKEVSYVSLSQKTASVSATREYTKTVDLNVNVTGSVPSGYELESKDVPSQVTIKGSKSAINSVKSLTAADVDLSKIKSSQTIKLSITLPTGVELADKDKNIGVKVVLKTVTSKTFTLSASDIDTTNVDSSLNADVSSGKFKVTVKGISDVVDAMSAGDITLKADCSGLSEGKHKVTLKASTDSNVTSISVSPSRATVTLKNQ